MSVAKKSKRSLDERMSAAEEKVMKLRKLQEAEKQRRGLSAAEELYALYNDEKKEVIPPEQFKLEAVKICEKYLVSGYWDKTK